MVEFWIVIVIADIMKMLSIQFVKNKSRNSYSMGTSGISPGVQRLKREAGQFTSLYHLS